MMKSSAKVTAITFLAATALGAVLISGCELSSGTVDDTDGGTQEPTPDSGPKADTGTDSGGNDAAATCDNPKQTDPFTPAACQECLNGSCCTALQTCFNIPAASDGSTTDCNAYSECINDCNADPANDTNDKKMACYADICDATAAEGVKEAYDALLVCAESSCGTNCQ